MRQKWFVMPSPSPSSPAGQSEVCGTRSYCRTVESKDRGGDSLTGRHRAQETPRTAWFLRPLISQVGYRVISSMRAALCPSRFRRCFGIPPLRHTITSTGLIGALRGDAASFTVA
ncbi:hypothetical protein ILYODFUR_018663 [Ilyodon furcidens]|uniref:Uncharacterized protein n=1 Tax=Ilyodon furcidens TaxID=33524 RepID=A0ABV0SMP4_9TELE